MVELTATIMKRWWRGLTLLNFFAVMISIFIFATVLVPILFVFIMTFAGVIKGKQVVYDDEEEGYVIMPDGTVRFDYEEYVR
jgi:hypothetical protein